MASLQTGFLRRTFLRTACAPASWWRALFALALCLSVLGTTLLAAEATAAPSDGETEIARQRFLEGVRHYDQHDYDKARLAFLQAYLLKPHPAVLLNLAQSQLRAGRYAEAAENFAKYIRENPTAEAMSHAKAAFEEARDKVGEVSVEVNSTGAIINVDGSDVGKSPLPYAVYMMPGRHTVRASKGGLSADESLEAIAGQRMYVTLALPEGSRMAPVAGAAVAAPKPEPAAAPPAANYAIPERSPTPQSRPESDTQRSRGFFSWLGSSPLAVATVTVAGMALGTSAVLAGFANNRYASANNARDQIMNALQEYVDARNLVGSAVPCGPQGIANNPEESFDAGVSADNVKKVSSQFGNACARFSERSDSGDRLKTLSLISLGVGAFATVGTIVWYFSDTGGSPSETTEAKGGSRRQARLTPVFSPAMSGVLLDVSF
ncbi:MAG: tetratricopeptide repeat protein [Deltaproteobacteria bacterium]